MLLPIGINPQSSTFYLASFVLASLKEKDGQAIFDLYQNVREKHEMSIQSFLLCLDWLYLANIASMNSEGDVILCS